MIASYDKPDTIIVNSIGYKGEIPMMRGPLPWTKFFPFHAVVGKNLAKQWSWCPLETMHPPLVKIDVWDKPDTVTQYI